MNGRLVSVDRLDPADRRAMHRLLHRHFAGVTARQFDADLGAKNWAILLRDDGDRLVGFSTLLYYHADDGDGRRLAVVYSGDTIVDPSAWGSPGLPKTWIESVRRLHARDAGGDSDGPPLYWLLITSGFRTYRFLPVFWRRFYPRHDEPTPPHVQMLIDRLAVERFGGRYNAAKGVVRFDRPQVLRPHLAGSPSARPRDPHIAFFNAVNPGHVRGDELVCLTALDDANLTAAGRRMVFGSARPAAPEAAQT